MSPIFLVTVFLLFATATASPTCNDHPAYTSSTNPVLLHSWHIVNGNKFSQANYHPRQTFFKLYPKLQPTSTKYHNLDFFWANGATGNSDRFLQLHLHRPAKVHLLIIHKYNRDYPAATLSGWKSEGYADRDPDTDGQGSTFKSGVHQTLTRYLPRSAYVFSKVLSTNSFYLPSRGWLDANVKGIENASDLYVFLSEVDGSASKPPKNPGTVSDTITPNQPCPEALHALWVTKNTDSKDRDTQGKYWPTWHPMWDPCYWCAYNHEHGSSPKHLMNYSPKFGYTAWKNGREKEPHNGFKGVVFKSENFLIYFSLHAHTSSLRRISKRIHTITLVVVDADTKELLVEITHKAFFGFLATRGKKESFIPLTAEDKKIMEELKMDNWSRNKRSVNVIDLDNLNPDYEYHEPRSSILRGRYEDWTTKPLCGGPGRYGMVTVDFVNPSTGIKSVTEMDTKVLLGFNYGKEFIRNDGSSRLIAFHDFRMSEDDCVFKLKDIKRGMSVDGTFYTDAYGQQIVRGPGPSSVRQFIKPGFEMKLSGMYRPIDVWVGMFEEDADGRFTSYGFGLDPDEN